MKKEEYAPDNEGFWEIYGEDPNCDFGGQHTEPYMCVVYGHYKNALAYARTLPGFITWSDGGTIKRVSIKNVG